MNQDLNVLGLNVMLLGKLTVIFTQVEATRSITSSTSRPPCSSTLETNVCFFLDLTFVLFFRPSILAFVAPFLSLIVTTTYLPPPAFRHTDELRLGR